MKKIVFLLLLVIPFCISAKGTESELITPIQINKLFSDEYKISLDGLFDVVDKEEKVLTCTQEYIKKQSKTYLKFAQNNLYELMNNFDGVVSKLTGKKASPDNTPYEDKVELLAKVQCEAYYKMGVLK